MESNVTERSVELHSLLEKVSNSDISSTQRVITQIIHVINDSHSTAKDLKEIIDIDPPLTGKVLKRANSAFYANRRKFSDILQAIVWVGFDAVKQLALSQKVCELFESDENLHGYSRLELWKHSVAVALFGKFVYRREFSLKGDNIYAAGLMHDIGIIIEDQFLHEHFVRILDSLAGDGGTMLQLERQILGFDHAFLAEKVTSDWSLPEELVAAIANHHVPEQAPSEHHRICKTLFIADQVCHSMNIGFAGEVAQDRSLLDRYLSDLEMKETAVDYIADEVEDKISLMEEEGWFQNGG